jgi:hypothetical protein
LSILGAGSAGIWWLAFTLSSLQSGAKALDDKVESKFSAQDDKVESKFTALDDKVESKFSALDDKMESKFSAQDDKMESKFTALDNKINALDEKMDTVLDLLREQADMLSCLPRAFGSVAVGLREVAAGVPLHSLVAAEPGEVAAWLKRIGYEQYAPALAPLGGASLLLQTEASLQRAGVAAQHCKPLLELIIVAARSRMDGSESAR